MNGKAVKIAESTYERLTAYLREDQLAPSIKAAVSVAVDRWLDEQGAPKLERELAPAT